MNHPNKIAITYKNVPAYLSRIKKITKQECIAQMCNDNNLIFCKVCLVFESVERNLTYFAS